MPYNFKDQKTSKDKLEWIGHHLKRAVLDSRSYVRNRFFDKPYLIDTKLDRGQWHETQDQMLHGVFSTFCDYVEIQKAWMGTWGEDDFKIPWFRRWREWRSREYAEKYFDWECSLVFDEGMGINPGDEKYGQPTRQAISTMKQRNIYHWWRDKRPTRPDPYPDEDPWDKNLAWKRFLIYLETCAFPVTDELREHYSWAEGAEMPNHPQMFIDAYYDYEDTEMMKAVIDIRTHLWT